MARTAMNPFDYGIMSDRLIFRPEVGEDAPAEDYTLGETVAGGLFSEAGFQYDPISNRLIPLKPSGVFSPGDEDTGAGAVEEPGDGFFKLTDVLKYRDKGMDLANFGGQNRVSVFDIFKSKGGNTFDIDMSAPYADLLTGTNAAGERVPLNEAVDERGNKLSRGLIDNRIAAALASIDESGVNDGEGPGPA